MAIVKLDICNLALSHIGQDAITQADLDGDLNESARHLNTNFDFSRDFVLRAKGWRFASVKEALVATEDEVSNWDYVYTYPAKCLRINKLFYDTESKDPVPIEFEVVYLPSEDKKVIATGYDDAYIDYNYQVTDPDLFDASFITALAYLLAAKIAKPLTGDNDTAKLMLELYYSLVSDASRLSESGQYMKPKQTSSFEDVR